MAVIVAVDAPVMVAALVIGNDIVDVIDAVSEDVTGRWDRPAPNMLEFREIDVTNAR